MTLSLKFLTILMFVIGGPAHQPLEDGKAINTSSLNIQNLAKKWQLHKYKYLIFSEDPAENERGDYIHLKLDMTFESVSEGVKEHGNWRLDVQKKRIYLSKIGDSEELVFIVKKLSKKDLVLIIDDPSDEDAKNLKIYFKV